MTKDEFIAQIAKKMNCSLPEADERLSAIIEAIQDIWKTDSELTLPGFGKFSVAKQAARMGYDPYRKKKIPVSAKAKPIFKAGQALCMHVNNWVKSDA
jgi:nucleoid DNA-binding protein